MKQHDDPGHVLCMWFLDKSKKVIWHMRPLIEWNHHGDYKNATAMLNSRPAAPVGKPAAASTTATKTDVNKTAAKPAAGKPAGGKTPATKTTAKPSTRKV